MLKFYVISIIVTIIISEISLKAIANKTKRQGYTIVRDKNSFAEKLKILIYFCIPLFNIFLMFVALFAEDAIIENLIERKALVKKEN